MNNGAKAAALVSRGIAFLEKGKADKALRAFDEAIAVDPGQAAAHCQRGNALADLGQGAAALASYDRAIALDATASEPHDFRGILLAQAGHADDALRSIDRALALDADNLSALNNRANVLRSIGRLEEALTTFDAVLDHLPDFAGAHNSRAYTLVDLGHHAAALDAFDRVIALDPSQIEPHCNRATALSTLDRHDEAIAAYQHALSIDPDHLWSLFNLGEALARAERLQEAEASYRRAIERKPDFVEALVSLGFVLAAQRRFDEAVPLFQRAFSIDLANLRALEGFAAALEGLGRRAEALVCHDHLIAVAPDDANAHRRRGQALVFLTQYEAAIDSLDRAAALDPAARQTAMRLHAAMQVSRWDGFEQQMQDVRAAIVGGIEDVMPFPVLALSDDPALQLACARRLAGRHPLVPAVPLAGRYPRHDRIRLGYFSADFHHHATMQLLAETIEAHDRSRFDLTAFSFGHGGNDDWQRRAAAAFDRFVDVRLLSDAGIAQRARELEIDIAIDLKGYTRDCRFGIFAERAAPVQVGYLGYPGTCGATCIDYLIADRCVIPVESRPFYSENIVYLPGSYQANPALRPIGGDATRVAAGLTDGGMVFCCFNQNYKIVPEVFDSWLRILDGVDRSILWLWVDSVAAQSNLRHAAAARGIDPARIVFATRLPTEQHLDRLRLAGLFLDTWPCNAHTTASDALRAGVPVLTHAGRTFAGRVAASLLTDLDLPDLVTTAPADYEALAIDLGRHPERLASIRARLVANLPAAALFNPSSMARRLERAFAEMYDRHHRGDAPGDLAIPG